MDLDQDESQFGDLMKFKFPKNDKNDPQYFEKFDMSIPKVAEN